MVYFEKLAAQYKQELLNKVLPFWLEKSQDKEYGGYFDGSKADILAELTGYKWWKRKFKITIPALAAIIYKVEFLPEPKEIPLPMLDEASIDIDRKRLRAEHEN